MADPQDRRRWLMFGAIAVGVAILLLLAGFVMTRPGERPTFVDTGSSAPSTTGATLTTTAPPTSRCTSSPITPATPLPRGRYPTSSAPTTTTGPMQPTTTSTTTTTAVPAPRCP